MQQPSPDRFYAEIQASAGKLADIISTHSPDLPIPTCPDWSLRQLSAHLGRVHRWAAQIVTTRAAERIPFDAAPDGSYPAERAAQAAWLTAGADRVIAAVRDAGSAQVWAFGSMAPATFWARRQAHETMVHRADAELAAGREVALDPVLAADAIDEWLTQVADPRYRRRAEGTDMLPAGAVLQLQATDVPGSLAEWQVRTDADGIAVHRGHGTADVTVAGPASRLLLVLVRRLPPGDRGISVTGDATLLAGWLAGTPY